MGIIFKNKVFKELRTKIGKLADAKVRVGILEGGDDEVESEYGDLTIVELATIHEYGAPAAGIPERSFLRKTFTGRGRAELAAFQAEQAKQVIEGKLGARTALKRIGTWGAAKVRERIRAHIDPPLKPATIKRKGSSTPLVDTGHLINAISFQLEEQGGEGEGGGE